MNSARVWSLRIFCLAVVSVLLVCAFFLGRYSTQRTEMAAGTSCEPRRTTSATSPASSVDAGPRCGNSKEEVAARNVYWRMWNGGNGINPRSTPDELAAMYSTLFLHPDRREDDRFEGLQGFHNLYFQRHFPDYLVYKDADVQRIEFVISAGTTEQRLKFLRQMLEMNGGISRTLLCVLDDEQRMKVFLRSDDQRTVPLETLHDGSTP
jgi:hypothetical protein